MLPETLLALAAAAGNALVQAAGTDAWVGLRRKVAQLLGRGDQEREAATLERLDQSALALTQVGATEVEGVRIRQEASWQVRIEALFEELNEAERELVAAQLRRLLQEFAPPSAWISAGAGDVVSGAVVDIRADGGSIAAGTIHGDANIGAPLRKDPAPPLT